MLNRAASANAFDPRDHANDPRVAFDLVRKGTKYYCTLCEHSFDFSNRAVTQLKGVHLRKVSHVAAMKKKLGICDSKAVLQPNIRSFFTPIKKPHPVKKPHRFHDRSEANLAD